MVGRADLVQRVAMQKFTGALDGVRGCSGVNVTERELMREERLGLFCWCRELRCSRVSRSNSVKT